MKKTVFALALVLPLAGLIGSATAAEQEFPPPKSLGELAGHGKNIQRTMRLLAESTPEHRNTARVLFYGQSITEEGWWKLVAGDLRERFPDANLVIESRAIGGHSSQLLFKTAEADLYPFQPDLVIFHVYGAHDKYEAILRGIRMRTTAEVLQQNDHVMKESDLTEETDPAKLPPAGAHWDAFMNHNWLPSLSRKYQTELCDQRSHWKRYLADYGIKPSDLLRDGVHLNRRGEFLMAEIVKAHLRRDPSLDPSPAEAWVKTHEVGREVGWRDGKLRLDFDGNRIVALCRPGEAPPAAVTIDGRMPSENAGCYTFTRTTAYPGMNRPCLLRVGSQAPLVAEEWAATLRDISDDCKTFRFAVSGSVTGDDGEGSSTERFVSKSARGRDRAGRLEPRERPPGEAVLRAERRAPGRQLAGEVAGGVARGRRVHLP